MKTAISVSNLSRRFPVYKGGTPVAGETFLALDNISFDIQAGHSVGILGGNGAGKSTLLKILARIIPPTSGRAELHGRVGTLLEAGAGFHPELTGRDNIFLAGALLGMKEHEIRRQFDAIVEFASIGDFLETPVKRYSSGMYMRLAFSVAAHIEPEILLVDEVLAVGDAQFQKRCLERLQSLGEHGQTILFVSHSMPAVARLCRQALWLDHGKLRMSGPVAEVSTAYMKQEAASPGERVWPRDSSAPGNEMARLYGIRVVGPDGATAASINIGQPFGIEMEFGVLTGGHVLFPVLQIMNEWGSDVVWTTDVTAEHHGRPRPAGVYRCVVRFPANLMSEGLMSVTALLRSPLHGVPVFRELEAVHFQATEIIDGTTSRGAYPSDIPAAVRPKLDWEVEIS